VRHYIHTTALEFLVVEGTHFLMRVSVGKLLLWRLTNLFLHIVVCSLVVSTLSAAACTVIRGAGGALILGVYTRALWPAFVVLLSSPVGDVLVFVLEFFRIHLGHSLLVSLIHASRVTLMVMINMRQTS